MCGLQRAGWLSGALRTTHAVREFTDEPLPDDTLFRILDNARFASSGGNRQGTHVTVVRDLLTRQRLAELGIPGARRYIAQMMAGENPWNPIHPPGVAPKIIESTDPPESFVAPLIQAPVVLVVSVDLEVVAALDQDLDRIGLVSGASVYPLVWNILLAAATRATAATPPPWPSPRRHRCESCSACRTPMPWPPSYRSENQPAN
jgi:nitroreductase